MFGILGTAIGSLFGGGAGKALAGAIGGALGAKKDKDVAAKKAAALDANHFVRLREAALRGGFNPYDALYASGGGGYGGATGRMPIGTTAAMQNQFDKIEEILSGDYAKRKRREEVEAEILQNNLDIARRGKLGARQVFVSSVATGGKEDNPVPGAPNPAESGRETVTNPWGQLWDVVVNPFAPDAEMGEARYGDVAQEFIGFRNVVTDAKYASVVRQEAAYRGVPQLEVHREILERGPDYYRQLEREVEHRRILPDPERERQATERRAERAARIFGHPVPERNTRVAGFGSRSQAEQAYK